jgi:hypothetical protein
MAHVRRFMAEGIDVAVVRKGDPGGGLVVLKLTKFDRQAGFGPGTETGPGPECRVFTQTRDPDGRMAWFGAQQGAFMPESEADSYIERAVNRDPDLWVVEIETADGTNPFEGNII